MNAARQRMRQRRTLAGLSSSQRLQLPNGQRITLSDAGKALKGVERLTQVRWRVYADLYLQDLKDLDQGKLSPGLFESFWAGEAGQSLRALGEELAKIPEAWAELEAFSKQNGLGSIVVNGLVAIGIIGATTAGVATIAHYATKADVLKEARLAEEARVIKLALEQGREAPDLSEREKPQGLLNTVASGFGKGALLLLAGGAATYFVWKGSKPAVTKVREKLTPRSQRRIF